MFMGFYMFSVFGCIWVDPHASGIEGRLAPHASGIRGRAKKNMCLEINTFLSFLTHNRALNFLETAYCRELRYGTLCFSQHRLTY